MDLKLKQRLTGAVVLVALAVIFVPIILEGPDNEWTPRSHSVPEQPQMDYRASMELELPQQTTAAPAGGDGVISEALSLPGVSTTSQPNDSESASAASVADPATKPVAAASNPEPKSKTKPKPKAEAVKPTKTAPSPAPASKKNTAKQVTRGWYVQVGSFGQEMNASGLSDRLKSAGYTAQLQKASIGSGYAYRVLVGPSNTRAGAESNAVSLKSKLQLSGMVVEYP